MLGSETFELEGRVEVVAANLPADMNEAERVRAKAVRETNVVIVLERHQAAVEAAINDRLATIMPDGVSSQTQVKFDDAEPMFHVCVAPHSRDEHSLDRKAISAALPDIVSDAVAAQIAERATLVGMWRADVKTAIKSQAEPQGKGSPSAQLWGGYSAVVWLLGLAVVGAAAWLYLRSSS